MGNQKVSTLQIIDSLPLSPRQIIIIMLCALGVIFDGYELQMISYVTPVLAKQWQLTPVQAGLIASWGFFGMLFGALTLGPIADYIGRKKAMISGLIIFSVFIGLGAFCQDITQLSIVRFLAGLGMGGVLPIAITIVAEFAPSHLRTRTIAIVTGGLTLGFALAGTVATLVIPVYGWRPMFIIGAIPLLLVPFQIWFLPESVRYLLRRNKKEEAAKILRTIEKSAGKTSTWNLENLSIEENHSTKSTLRELWTPKYRWITLRSSFMYLLLQIVVVAFNFWVPSLMINKGFSLVRSYSYGIEQGVGAAVGGILLGWFVDRATRKISRKYSMAAIVFLGAVSLWLFGLANSVLALYVFAGLAAMFVVGGQNIIHSMITDVYSTRTRSTAIGWGLGVARIGSIIGPTLGGIFLAMKLPFQMYFILFSIPLILASLIILSFPKHADESAERSPAEVEAAAGKV